MGNFRKEIDEIRSIETASSIELVVQTILVGIAITLAWAFLGLWQLPVWFIVEYGLIGVEKYLHSRPNQRYSRGLYLRYLALSFVLTSIASYLPIYLWFQGAEVFQYGAMAYLVGAVLNTFLVRAKAWPVLLCYLIPNAFVFFTIAVSLLVRSDYGMEGVIAVILAGLITTYFLVSVGDAIKRNRQHMGAMRELFQAQKMETLGNLAGGIAHDFNNLLGVVSGNLELLQKAGSDSERAELIAQAQVATERSASLTRQMLAFGRQTHLAPETVCPHLLLTEVEGMLTRLLPESIAVAVQCDPQLGALWVDKSALQSTLLNLALNARDAVKLRGVLSISAQPYQVLASGLEVSTGTLKGGDYVEFSVEDTGEGISPEVFGRVLEPFFTTKGVGEGSGLGLSMVVGFAREAEGGVHIRSVVGRGTRVSLFIPRRDPIPVDGPDAKVFAPAAPVSKPSIGNRVLLVEDEALLRTVIKKQLSTEGYAVQACESADLAVELVDSGFAPDIVLTDIVMPGTLQGTDLVQALRPRFPDAKYIVMTGYAFSQDLELASSEVDYSMISKPFKLRELSDHLNRVAR